MVKVLALPDLETPTINKAELLPTLTIMRLFIALSDRSISKKSWSVNE
jgi:hypothetical protein